MSYLNPTSEQIRFSLKWQVIAFMCLLILAVAGTLSWYFLRQSSFVLTGQFEAKARLLAETLAHSSESALLFPEQKTPEELEKSLGGFVDSALKESSVLR